MHPYVHCTIIYNNHDKGAAQVSLIDESMKMWDTRAHTHTHTHIGIYTHTHACTHIYTHIYTHTHTHI